MEKRTFHFIAVRLKQLRGKLSQGEFALKVGVPFRTYQRYESGERMPKSDTLERIAHATGRSSNWILTGADRVGEEPAPYMEDVSRRVLLAMEGLSKIEREDVLKYTEFLLEKKKREGIDHG